MSPRTQTSPVCAFLFCLLCVLQLTLAQVPAPGSCPRNIKTVQDFDVNRYLGRWYEYAKYPLIFELNGRCIYAEYGLLPNGQVSVFNSNVDKYTGKTVTINGQADITGPGKLVVQFDSMPAFLGGANYWVLDTDYENYAVVYSCFDAFLLHTKVVWILTRSSTPSAEIVQKAKDIIRSNNLSLDPLTLTDLQNCNFN